MEGNSAERADWGMAGECTSDHFPFRPVPFLSSPFEPTRTSQTLEVFFISDFSGEKDPHVRRDGSGTDRLDIYIEFSISTVISANYCR